jgi:hypothetical protein
MTWRRYVVRQSRIATNEAPEWRLRRNAAWRARKRWNREHRVIEARFKTGVLK